MMGADTFTRMAPRVAFAALLLAGAAAQLALAQPGAVPVPPGYVPPPGACRIWFPDRPPPLQPPPGPCDALMYSVPPGALLIHGGPPYPHVVQLPPQGPGAVPVPPEHLPPPGACRIWFPGRPPPLQPPPGPCQALIRSVPPGALLINGGPPYPYVVQLPPQGPGLAVPPQAVAPGPAPGPGVGSKQAVGGILGGVVGGLLGSRIGSGSGRLAATAAGTLFGVLIGSEIGRTMDEADRMRAEQAYAQATTAAIGQQITWRNPETGNHGTVTPTREGTTSSGQQCREFQQTVTVGGKTEQAFGKACRQPDGSWKVVQ